MDLVTLRKRSEPKRRSKYYLSRLNDSVLGNGNLSRGEIAMTIQKMQQVQGQGESDKKKF